MIASVLVGVRRRSLTVLCLAVLGSACAQAADCPGNPNALGTSRTLVVDPKAHPRIGTMQYRETLPLADHEVVLTFDDGPLPKYSNQVLQILASQCVKATFFIVGRQANANPEGVRKYVNAGHTVGTHSQNHPLTFDRMSAEKAQAEIDGGIASTLAALNGDKSKLAPFFRIPGLLRAQIPEDYAASQGLQVWSADFPADDWRHVSPQRVYDLAIQRIEAKRKGILLLHDIQPRTVAALPRILNELKARGYRIVHVVPATPELPATPTEPQQWFMHPPTENVAITRWPPVPNFVFTTSKTLPAPVLAEMDWRDAELIAHAVQARVAAPQRTAWPQVRLAQAGSVATLPIPATSVFRIPEGRQLTLLASRSRPPRANLAVSARAKPVAGAAGARHAVHQPPHAAKGTKHADAGKKTGRPLRIANLKKR
ncbi:polysaccharide deacetylase family protein [Bradyrhizobium jicamae]|uniref:polysaccharide deacetylase family protein n=1 Tax=Bradyrhizobium jicamae TaxID=280332 RepID=UPI001BA5E7FC|nr:polysaccharide deacetylase family protein [Bradyrhizobium jicamae]MBR0752768.1 polysaccharide deacetylase family protein [Bradyrhizobium jicamae]